MSAEGICEVAVSVCGSLLCCKEGPDLTTSSKPCYDEPGLGRIAFGSSSGLAAQRLVTTLGIFRCGVHSRLLLTVMKKLFKGERSSQYASGMQQQPALVHNLQLSVNGNCRGESALGCYNSQKSLPVRLHPAKPPPSAKHAFNFVHG